MPQTDILTPEQIAEIEARYQKATPGPWYQSALAGMYVVADGADYRTVACVAFKLL